METEKTAVLLTEEIRQLKIISQAKSETIEKMEKRNHQLKEQVGLLIKENMRLDCELDSFKFSPLICAPDYESECKNLRNEMECRIAKMTEEHHSKIEQFEAEIESLKVKNEQLQNNFDTKNLDYWELSGKVEAYEMCIRAFTGTDE